MLSAGRLPRETQCAKIAHMAMVKDSAELGARIQQFRRGMNLDQETLARECTSRGKSLDRTALSRIESGQRKVTALELAVLAEVLGVSFIDLVSLPEPDVIAARTPITEESTNNERDDFLASVEIDRAWRDACQLRDAGFIEPVESPFGGAGLNSYESARDLAQQVRKFLDAGDEPLGDMSDIAAQVGLWCRTTSAGIDGQSLTPEPGMGVALIGQDLDPGRRRATVAHEIGHHICRDTYESSGHYNSPREVEGFIDAFASEFLLPRAVLKRVNSPTRDCLIDIAASYRVSWSLAVQTAKQTHQDLADATVQLTPNDEDFYRVVGAKPQPDLVPPGLPRRWIQAVAQAVEKYFITPRRAAEMTAGVVGA